MNKILLIAFFVLVTISMSNAQNFSENFLGRDYLQYKGVLFKLDDNNSSSGWSYKFYGSISDCQSKFNRNVIYPEPKYNFNTSKDSLANRIFLVLDIVDKENNSITSYSRRNEPIFILEDTSNKQIIYYLYDEKFEHSFPFITSKIEFNEKEICNKISPRTDDFTNETTYESPIMDDNEISPMIFYKTKSGGSTFYNLSLRTIGNTINIGQKGVIVLFSDGSKMEKRVKVDVEANEKGFEYSSFITLNKSEAISLSKKKIKKFRLYIYDQDINPLKAEKFSIFVDCILNKMD